MTNCPNCGAPLHSDICEYCQTMVIRRNEPNFDIFIQFPYPIKKSKLKEKLDDLRRQLTLSRICYIDSDSNVTILRSVK